MKKAVYGFLGLIVLLVAAALIVPSVIDWNGYKTEISAEVRKATGRSLDIAGDLEFTALPSPRLRISGARLSNAPGATADHMVSLKELRVSVALLPLIQGDVEIGQVELIDPVIELEKLPDGRMNWLFTPQESRESVGSTGSAANSASPLPAGREKPAAGHNGGTSAFKLDALTIKNGTIVYRDKASATLERIEKLTADISAGSLSGPFTFKGGLTVRDTPLTVSADVKRLVEKGAVPFRMTLGTPATKAEIGLSGTVTDVETKPSISAKLHGKGDDLATLVSSLTRSATVPYLAQSFAVSATVAGSDEAVTVNDLTFELGVSKATGNIKVALRNGVRADIALRMASLDANALMAAVNKSPAPAATSSSSGQPAASPSSPGGQTAAPSPTFELPGDIEANIDLTIDEVIAMQDRVRSVRLSASLLDGAVMLNALTAGFPGATELSASGKLTSPQGALTYAGKTAIRSANLRRLLTWAGVDVAAVPADRLRRFNVSADVSGNAEQVQAVGIVAQLDASRLSGGLTVALRDRAAFGASISIDQFNADAYIGKPAPVASEPDLKAGGQTPDAPGQTMGQTPGNTPMPKVEAKSPLAVLNDFDANLTFRVGSLSYQRTAIQGVRLDSTLVNGVLTLRDASVRNLAGTSAQIKGTLSGLAGIPAFKGTVAAASDDLTGFFKIAGIKPPVSPRKLGKMRLTSRTDASKSGVTIDANLQLAEVSAKITGKVSDLAASPVLDISVDAQHPELARLANLFASGKPGPAVGRVGLKMTLKGGERAVVLDMKAGVAGGAFKIAGTIGTPLGLPQIDLAADVSHPDLVRFVRAFDPGFKPANPRLGGLSMAVKLTGTEENLAIGGLSGKIGPTSVSGQGRYRAARTGAARPDVKLSLVTSAIPLSDFLEAPPQRTGKQRNRTPQGGPGNRTRARTSATTVPPGQRWSTDTFDTDALGLVDADIDLRAEAVLYQTFRIDQPKIVAVLKDKVLDVQRVAGTMFDGGFEMRGKVDGRGLPAISTSVTITKANVGKALFQAAEFDIATGILSFGMDLSARGRSQFDMVKALAGQGKIDVVDGIVKGFDLKRASENLKNINQLAGLLGVLSSSMEGGETRFSSLKGTFEVTKGIIITNDLELVADAGAGNARGFVNLPKWHMDMFADFRLTEHSSAPPFRVRAVGPPDNPRRLIDFQALQAWVLQRGVGGLIQNLVPGANKNGGSQQQQQQPKPEDIIRGLLKGFAR